MISHSLNAIKGGWAAAILTILDAYTFLNEAVSIQMKISMQFCLLLASSAGYSTKKVTVLWH